MKTKIPFLVILPVAAAALIGGCAAPGKQMCDAPAVGAEEIQLDQQANKLMTDDHIYFSKEGSSGGRSFGSGGCGCN